jgi:hypothetical protein
MHNELDTRLRTVLPIDLMWYYYEPWQTVDELVTGYLYFLQPKLYNNLPVIKYVDLEMVTCKECSHPISSGFNWRGNEFRVSDSRVHEDKRLIGRCR